MVKAIILYSWFDVLNSRCPTHPKRDIKAAYGTVYEKQKAILDKTYKYVLGMKAVKKRGPYAKSLARPRAALIPFQDWDPALSKFD